VQHHQKKEKIPGLTRAPYGSGGMTLSTMTGISSAARNCTDQLFYLHNLIVAQGALLRRQEANVLVFLFSRTRQVAKPYFREWSNLRHAQGKTFVSNPRLFRGDKALYFPNMYGATLASPKEPQNTTSVLRGKISIVTLFSSLWAESQVATFTGPKQNPVLAEALAKSGQVAQKVDINLEENRMRAWLVKRFMWRMRQNLPAHQHERYFLVQKGVNEVLKEAIGMMNSKVGYVYLVDAECRIRWAGSGPAEETEMAALNAGLLKLIAEKQNAAQ
jgi:ATPase complex subunit ATP10